MDAVRPRPSIRIRPYMPEDCDRLIAVFRSAVREAARRDYTEEQVQAWAPHQIDREAWAARRSAKPTWVAEIDGVAVGFIDLEADGHIDMLFVSAEHQRLGVAGALYRQLEATAKANGASRLYTEASITARPFFERRGFAVLAEQTVERRGQTFVNYQMEKRLG